MTTETDNAESQAKAQLQSIVAMMERLEHVGLCRPGICDLPNQTIIEGLDHPYIKGQDTAPEERDLYHDQDAAQQAIYDDPLSVLVRSGWYDAGGAMVGAKGAVEYEILLCTGGPAVRIRGDLDNYGQPQDARLEYQDWGTPWTYYMSDGAPALVAYAQQFYFGD